MHFLEYVEFSLILVYATAGNNEKDAPRCFANKGQDPHELHREDDVIITGSPGKPTYVKLQPGQTCVIPCWLNAGKIGLLNGTRDTKTKQSICTIYHQAQFKTKPSWHSNTVTYKYVRCGTEFGSRYCTRRPEKEHGFWLRFPNDYFKEKIVIDVLTGISAFTDCESECTRHPICNHAVIRLRNAYDRYTRLNNTTGQCELAIAQLDPIYPSKPDLSVVKETYVWNQCTFRPERPQKTERKHAPASQDCVGRLNYSGNLSLPKYAVVNYLDFQNQARCREACLWTPNCSHVMFYFDRDPAYTQWVCLVFYIEPHKKYGGPFIQGHVWNWTCVSQVTSHKPSKCRCTTSKTTIFENNCGRIDWRASYKVPAEFGILTMPSQVYRNGAWWVRVSNPLKILPKRVYGWVKKKKLNRCRKSHCRHYEMYAPSLDRIYVNKKTWYAFPPLDCPLKPYPKKPRYVIIMDGGVRAGENASCYGRSVCSSVLRLMQWRDQFINNYCFMRSNFYISNDGYIYEGLGPLNQTQITAPSWNIVSMSVHFLGHYRYDMPLQPAIKAFEVLMSDLRRKGYLAPSYSVMTLNDITPHDYNPGYLLQKLATQLPYYKGRPPLQFKCIWITPYYRLVTFWALCLSMLVWCVILYGLVGMIRCGDVLLYLNVFSNSGVRHGHCEDNITGIHQYHYDTAAVEDVAIDEIRLVTVCTDNENDALAIASALLHEDSTVSVVDFVNRISSQLKPYPYVYVALVLQYGDGIELHVLQYQSTHRYIIEACWGLIPCANLSKYVVQDKTRGLILPKIDIRNSPFPFRTYIRKIPKRCVM